MRQIERSVLRHLFDDVEYAARVTPHLKEDYFYTAEAGTIYRLFLAFYHQYQTLPQFAAIKIAIDVLTDLTEKQIEATFEALAAIEAEPALNESQLEWLLTDTEKFCRERAVFCGLQQSIKIMNDPDATLYTIPDILKNALAVSFDTHIGHDFFDDADARFDFYHKVEERLPFDLDVMNRITRGGIPRKTLNIVMAGCHAKGERVRLFTGATKAVESITTDDVLMGWDGTPRRVQQLYSGRSPLYRITVRSTGDTYTVNDTHILTLVNTQTDHVIDIPIQEYLQKTAKFKHIHKTFYCQHPVEFAETQPLTINPYIMGMWLGLHITEQKFIPVAYKTACIQDRLELLAGLIDTDGSLRRRRQSYEITLKSPQLIDDIKDVARSLGFYCYQSIKCVRGIDYHRLSICPTPHTPTIPVRVPRKQIVGTFNIRRNLTRSGFDIECIGDGEFYGFVVDGDHRYLIDNWIVTHNTNVGKSLALCHFAASWIRFSKNVLYITLEMSEERIAERIDANLMNIPLDDLEGLTRDQYIQKLQHVRAMTTGRLKIKEFPTASAHVGHFKALLQDLRLKENFIPDVIIVDYITICASSRIKMGSSVNSYTLYKFVAEELRGLSAELGPPIFTAAQFNRTGFNSSDPSITDIGESWGIPQTADFMVALVQTEELEKVGQIGLYQMKNRYRRKNTYTQELLGIDTCRMKLYDIHAPSSSSVVSPPVQPTPSTGWSKPTFNSLANRRRPLSALQDLAQMDTDAS